MYKQKMILSNVTLMSKYAEIDLVSIKVYLIYRYKYISAKSISNNENDLFLIKDK